MLELLRERGERPSAHDVAERAGVSLRTVYRHFDDVEALVATAVEHQLRHVGHRFAPLAPMPVDDFVAHRAALFEEIGPVRRAGLGRAAHQAVQGLTESHRLLRAQLRSVFDADGLVLEALDAVTSWAAWDVLRRDQGLSVSDASAVIAHTVATLLEGRSPRS
jgi:AcrR family transcriptional regulator